MKSAITIPWAVMRVYLVALAVMAATASAAPKNQELAPIRSVYLMPMSSGFDQYLANRIASTGRFTVVTDPAAADAVLTDRLGLAFETRMMEMYPPEKKAEEEEENARDRESRVSTFGRGRGNLFMVDRHRRQVVWSAFKLPRNMQPDELDRLAEYFAEQLKKQAPPSSGDTHTNTPTTQPAPASAPEAPDTTPPTPQ